VIRVRVYYFRLPFFLKAILVKFIK